MTHWYEIGLNNIQGDLLDEGYIATDDEFQEYKVFLKRNYQIGQKCKSTCLNFFTLFQ